MWQFQWHFKSWHCCSPRISMQARQNTATQLKLSLSLSLSSSLFNALWELLLLIICICSVLIKVFFIYLFEKLQLLFFRICLRAGLLPTSKGVVCALAHIKSADCYSDTVLTSVLGGQRRCEIFSKQTTAQPERQGVHELPFYTTVWCASVWWNAAKGGIFNRTHSTTVFLC